MKQILTISVNYGLRDPKLRWVMLAAPFVGGISIYAFYALQPYILEMYGDEQAYVIAGLAAAAVAGAQIAGGFAAPYLRQLFRYRTSALLAAVITSGTLLILVGLVHNLWVVLILVVMWGLVFAASSPIRQAYINSLIPSQQRATIISMGSLMDSTGGVVIQPVLGRAADVWSYGPSFLLSGVINLFAAPFLLLARREQVAGESAEKPVLEEAKN